MNRPVAVEVGAAAAVDVVGSQDVHVVAPSVQALGKAVAELCRTVQVGVDRCRKQ
ncbi:hypothetical protein GCM10017708_39030 [Arthrobacter citreus]